MKISFICNPVYLNGGWSPWDTRIGGSEEFIVEVSKRLPHEVQVFHNGQHGIYEGVRYRDHSEFEPGDVTINVNYPEFEGIKGKTIYWTSLTDNPDLSKFDAVCVISEYAKKHTGVKHRNVYIVPPGYDPDKVYPSKKIPKQCFYASSPDRGLDALLEAWPKVYAAHPDATLLLTYGAQADLPGVICLGNADEDTVNEVYRTSDMWVYPCSGNELYCMTGVKAQAAGCVPLVIPHMALDETIKAGVKSTPECFAKDWIELLNNPNKRWKIRNELRQEHFIDWDESTQKLLSIIERGK